MNEIELERERNTNYESYHGDECFSFMGNPVASVFDFWRYHYGNLAGQSPVIAEFLVARALGIEKAENVTYWTAYDMSYRNVRIEVKATEYVHSWNRTHVSKVRTFSIAPSNNKYWGVKEGERKLSRQNDLYVFCLNTNQEIGHPQPLNVDFWEFYVITTARINRYAQSIGNPDQKNISLNVVKRMAGDAVSWDQLKEKIDMVIADGKLGFDDRSR